MEKNLKIDLEKDGLYSRLQRRKWHWVIAIIAVSEKKPENIRGWWDSYEVDDERLSVNNTLTVRKLELLKEEREDHCLHCKCLFCRMAVSKQKRDQQ